MVVDPVCHMTLEPAAARATATVSGQTVWFCSSTCRDRYVANPLAYAVAGASERLGPFIRSVRGAAIGGAGAATALLLVYFALLTALSGWNFARDEFGRYWPYIVALAVGFGLQVGLFLLVRARMRAAHAGKIVAVSGSTSGAAMVSCCSHYLVNLLPALGATGLVAFVGRYQVELFWLGIAANVAGLIYMGRHVVAVLKRG